jgi:hypothetical protein
MEYVDIKTLIQRCEADLHGASTNDYLLQEIAELRAFITEQLKVMDSLQEVLLSCIHYVGKDIESNLIRDLKKIAEL